MTPYIQVVTTLPDRTAAEQLAAHLLEQQLAACVQISACTSWYRWQGAIEQGEEQVCVIKSRRDLFPALSRAIRAHHPYEVPEILATPADATHVRDERNWHASELINRAVKIDTIMRTGVPADWKGDEIKERAVQRALLDALDGDREAMRKLFELVRNQPGYR